MKKFIYLLAALLLLLPFNLASADEPSKETPKEAVKEKTGEEAKDETKEEAKDETKPVRLKTVLVTGTRYEEKATKVPANVTVVESRDIERSTARSVPELLSGYPGIWYNNTTGSRRGDIIDMRGFGEAGASNSLVLVDDRRVNEIDLSGVDWTTIPLDRVERIEVVRGGIGATLYGDQAVGGVINIITRKGQARPRLTGKAAYGSYETFESSTSLDGAWEKGPVGGDYFLSGAHQRTKGYRDNGGFHMNYAGGSVGFDAADTFFVNLSGGIKEDHYGLPGGMTQEEITRYSRKGKADLDNHAQTDEYYVQATPGLDFGKFGTVKCSGTYKEKGSNFHALYPPAGWSPEFFWMTDLNIQTSGLSPQYILKTEFRGIKNNLTVGGDFYWYQTQSESFSYSAGWVTRDNSLIDKYSRAGYVQDSLEIAYGVSVSGGYRVERVKYDFMVHNYNFLTGAYNPSPRSGAVHEEEAYNAAINWNYMPGSHVFASWARSFRTPRTDEMFNYATNMVDPYLIPQNSRHYEAGIRHNFWDYATVSLTGFIIDTKNEIFYDPYQVTQYFFGLPITGSNMNYDRTKRKGTELEVTARPLGDLLKPWVDVELRGSWTHINAEFRGNEGVFRNTGLPKQSYDGLAVPGVPRDTIFGAISISLKDLIFIDVNGRWVDTRTIWSDWTHALAPIDSYTVFNARIGLKARGIELFVAGNNVFGEKYYHTAVTPPGLNPDYYPAAESSVMAGITLSTDLLDYIWKSPGAP